MEFLFYYLHTYFAQQTVVCLHNRDVGCGQCAPLLRQGYTSDGSGTPALTVIWLWNCSGTGWEEGEWAPPAAPA